MTMAKFGLEPIITHSEKKPIFGTSSLTGTDVVIFTVRPFVKSICYTFVITEKDLYEMICSAAGKSEFDIVFELKINKEKYDAFEQSVEALEKNKWFDTGYHRSFYASLLLREVLDDDLLVQCLATGLQMTEAQAIALKRVRTYHMNMSFHKETFEDAMRFNGLTLNYTLRIHNTPEYIAQLFAGRIIPELHLHTTMNKEN